MNWWLMALAFILGIALTWLWTVRTATRELAVHRTTPATASGQSASRTALPGAGQPTPTTSQATPVATTPAATTPVATTAPAAATAATTKHPKKVKHDAPYGDGSAAAGTNGAGPEGWHVKGLRDSKVFHTPESSSFADTRADVWFKDAAAAEAAGFRRWDAPVTQDASAKQGATAV